MQQWHKAWHIPGAKSSSNLVFSTVLILMQDLCLLLHLWKAQLNSGWSKDLSTFDNEQSNI
jgi:hypothetical protein